MVSHRGFKVPMHTPFVENKLGNYQKYRSLCYVMHIKLGKDIVLVYMVNNRNLTVMMKIS